MLSQYEPYGCLEAHKADMLREKVHIPFYNYAFFFLSHMYLAAAVN